MSLSIVFMYGDLSNVAVANEPLREASTPNPVSGPSVAVPIENVPLAASSPFANSSCTVGARNERARLIEPVTLGVNRRIAPRDPVTALASREALMVRNTESDDCGYGRVWILL